MSEKKNSKPEVARKFAVTSGESYGYKHFFETVGEAQTFAQKQTFKDGEDVLIYQAIEKAVPNVKSVEVLKLV